ncbi:hypothetical protein [Rhodoferax antarcticus]|uniref:Uncharacterized protein n=1 Tax=Rhodoferax antarcticus ANT.BR TaxID=1111071 RepID=A0A1Q8Y8V3_9BURK|nr:hypothetical protein [Rhodoferax antarcticus]OLP04482.1 hypothetical protein BLL52_4291 [Rhodoferax antarcticus ANT.BR]
MILNLTQHAASAEQLAVGVVDLPPADKAHLVRLLTVDSLPSRAEIDDRCADIATLASLHEPVALQAMIGGAPWMMSALEGALMDAGIEPIYAFSERDSVDQHQPDGSVRKVAVFRHVGFVPAR